jgi:hypothetical protein
MTADVILPYLTGPAAALVILVWVVIMLRQDIKDLRRVNEAANKRADSAEEAARSSLEMLRALTGQGAIADRERARL